MKKLKMPKINVQKDGYVKSLQKMEKIIASLVAENNRKNDEIRQIKKKLRANAHYSRV